MKLDITAGPSTLDDVQTALDDFWSHHDEVPREVRMEVGIAAAEIVANILEHGCACGLHMEIQVLPDAVEIEFTDDGNPAEVDLFTVRMPDEDAERGRGLPLAQAALRMLAYFRDEVGNHWKLVSKAITSAGKNET
ncbi:MAG: ATP-binding protein [Mycobacterium sp.]